MALFDILCERQFQKLTNINQVWRRISFVKILKDDIWKYREIEVEPGRESGDWVDCD